MYLSPQLESIFDQELSEMDVHQPVWHETLAGEFSGQTWQNLNLTSLVNSLSLKVLK